MGLHDAGIRRSVGVEFEPTAAATARAAGFMVHEGDVRQIDPRELVNRYSLAADAVLLLQSSPPCQGLSMAGKGVGREDLQRLMTALDQLAKMGMDDARYWSRWWLDKLTLECSDEKSPLTFETIRWVADLTPEYVMLEQVPTALPIWEAFAKVLDAWGYSTWTGNVQAEQFGVPQTRKRAFLLASRVSEVSAPTPTHSKYHTRAPERLDEGVQKWVSMAEALGWSERAVMTSNYGSGGDASNRGVRHGWQPAPTVTSKIDRNKVEHSPSIDDAIVCSGQNSRQAGGATKLQTRSVHKPSLTITGQTGSWTIAPVPAIEGETVDDLDWAYGRPSPTIVGSFAPDVVAKPGYRKAGDPPPQKTPGSVRVTVEEAGVLQSFPHDFPWQGTKGKQFQQVGNAVPPLLQQALASQVLTARVTCTPVLSATA